MNAPNASLLKEPRCDTACGARPDTYKDDPPAEPWWVCQHVIIWLKAIKLELSTHYRMLQHGLHLVQSNGCI